MEDRTVARELARSSVDRGDPTGWFEELYRLGEAAPEVVPWADMRPNPHLVSWTEGKGIEGGGRSALVVGCGYGDDAEWLSGLGFDVVAFDVSSTAVAAARQRFPRSSVDYRVADVLRMPAEWRGAFDLVFEAYTLQVLLGASRVAAAGMIASAVKDTLLVVARGRNEGDDPGNMPWPLTRLDLASFSLSEPDLLESSFEDFLDDETPPVRRFRVEYRRRRVSGP